MGKKLLISDVIKLLIEQGVNHVVFFERGSGDVAFVIKTEQECFKATLILAILEHQDKIINFNIEVTNYWPDKSRFWITVTATDEDLNKYYYQAEQTTVY